MALLGAYVGNDIDAVTHFERAVGRLDLLTCFVGEASPEDFSGSVSWVTNLFQPVGQPVFWSIPLIWSGCSLFDAATGHCDSRWLNAAKVLAANRPHEPVVFVRTGWEQNGDWMKWAAKGREADYVFAFQRFVTIFRAVSHRFNFTWCPNIGQNDPTETYPGDRFVDLVGLDFYHFPRWDPKDAASAWIFMVTRPYGLQWNLQFARSHRKPVCYPEWGVSSDGFEIYVRHMADWCRSSDVFYHAYWDDNGAYEGQLTAGQYPGTFAAFRSAFG